MAIRFDFTDLRLFLHVAEEASITHGATRTNMSLAAASERIRAMEEALRTPLLERKRRGVQLTGAGSALAHHARTIAHDFEQMRDELEKYTGGLRGSIRVFCSTVVMAEFLPIPLANFLSDRPNVDVELEQRANAEIIRAVAEGLVHVGIVGDQIDPAFGLDAFPLGEDRLVVVSPRKHEVSSRRKIAFRDVLQYDMIGLVSGNPLQTFLDRHAARAGQRLKLRIRLNALDAVCTMVERGIGLAVVPERTARRCQQSMAIRIIGLSDAWAIRHFTVCAKNPRSLPVHAQRFLEYLKEASLQPRMSAVQ